jgi:hypothetical protein
MHHFEFFLAIMCPKWCGSECQIVSLMMYSLRFKFLTHLIRFHCLFRIQLENIMHAAIMTVDQMIYSWFLSIFWKSKLFDQARIIFSILWGKKLVMFLFFFPPQKIRKFRLIGTEKSRFVKNVLPKESPRCKKKFPEKESWC